MARQRTEDVSLRIGLPRLVLALRGNLPGGGRDGRLLRPDQRQVVRQRLQEKVLVLDGHRRPDVDLDRQDAFELPTLLVQVDDVYCRMTVDPVAVVVPFGEDPVVVPLARSERLEGELSDHPGLTLWVDDDLLARVGQDAAAPLLVEHPVVVGAVGHHVALVAGDDRLAQVGPLRPPVLQAAVAPGRYLDLHPQLEVPERADPPGEEAVELQRAVGLAGEAAVFDRPVVRAPIPAGQVTPVEDRPGAVGRREGECLIARLQLLDADVPPADLIGTLAPAEGVDLEADEAGLVHVVGEVGGGDPVDPGPIAVPLDHDAIAVPAVVLEGVLRLGRDLGEPASTAALVIEPTGRPDLLAGDLALRAVDDARPLAVRLIRIILLVDVAADLDAGVEPGVALDLQFEHEVLVIPLAQERVGAAHGRRADDRTVIDPVRGESAIDLPAIERLAIEQRRPALVISGAGLSQADDEGEGRDRDRERHSWHDQRLPSGRARSPGRRYRWVSPQFSRPLPRASRLGYPPVSCPRIARQGAAHAEADTPRRDGPHDHRVLDLADGLRRRQARPRRPAGRGSEDRRGTRRDDRDARPLALPAPACPGQRRRLLRGRRGP